MSNAVFVCPCAPGVAEPRNVLNSILASDRTVVNAPSWQAAWSAFGRSNKDRLLLLLLLLLLHHPSYAGTAPPSQLGPPTRSTASHGGMKGRGMIFGRPSDFACYEPCTSDVLPVWPIQSSHRSHLSSHPFWVQGDNN
jgi:hypothetical protein